MASEILDGAGTARVKINEVMVCQMKALIRELWPDEFDVKPKLTIAANACNPSQPTDIAKSAPQDEVMECLLRARIREIKGFRGRPKLTLIRGGLSS